MPLTLTIEDGSQVPGANSYVSVAEADTYLSYSAQRAAWGALSDDGKIAALVQAARMLNGAAWKGSKVDIAQPLAWPRYGITDDQSRVAWDALASQHVGVYPDNAIPQEIKDAQSELAALQAVSDRAGDQDADGIKSVKVGKGALEVEFDASTRPTTYGKMVNSIIAPFCTGTGRTRLVKVIRV